MTSQSNTPESGNPYARIQDEEESTPGTAQMSLPIGPPPTRLGNTIQLKFYEYSSGNPYGNIDPDEDSEVEIAASIPVFKSGCNRIFRMYLPFAERRTLRPHQREFIQRNSRRSAKARGRILKALQTYDLSNLGHVTAQFNRERDPFTAAKLQEIENQAGE